MTNSKYITRLKRSEGSCVGFKRWLKKIVIVLILWRNWQPLKSSVERVIEMIITENLTECINQPLDDPEAQKERLEKAIRYLD